MIALTQLLLACDPLLAFMMLLGVGVAASLILLGVAVVVDSAQKRTCPHCKRWAQIEGDDPWI
jgi:CBS-domain-containing membrane protein